MTTYQREWYHKHADRINEKRRAKQVCPTCLRLFNKSSLKKHQQREGVLGVVWQNKLE